jgi:hypothetical protein
MQALKKPHFLEWVFSTLILLAGVAVIALAVFSYVHGTTSEEELTRFDEVPRDALIQKISRRNGGTTDILVFKIGGYKVEYGDDAPKYKEVLVAIGSGQRIQVWLSTKQETVLPRPGFATLYKVNYDGKPILTYSEAIDSKHGSWAFGLILIALGVFSTISCVRKYRSFRRASCDVGPCP